MRACRHTTYTFLTRTQFPVEDAHPKGSVLHLRGMIKSTTPRRPTLRNESGANGAWAGRWHSLRIFGFGNLGSPRKPWLRTASEVIKLHPMSQLMRFPSAVQRTADIEAWMREEDDELGAIPESRPIRAIRERVRGSPVSRLR